MNAKRNDKGSNPGLMHGRSQARQRHRQGPTIDNCRAETFEQRLALEQVIEARKQLVADGLVQMIGRTASGQAVYALTDYGRKVAASRNTPKWRHRFRFIGLFPALVLEHMSWQAARLLTMLLHRPPAIALILSDVADSLHQWREGQQSSFEGNIWLSIRLDD